MPALHKSLMVLLTLGVELLMTCCTKTSFVQGSASVTLAKTNSGCLLTIPHPEKTDPAHKKDPYIHILSSTDSKLTVVADDTYVIKFSPTPSPFGQDLTVPPGSHTFSVTIGTWLSALLSDRTFNFDVYDSKNDKCDPVLHVTR